VIVAALDATFERKPFGDICQLIAMAESVKKLSSVCLNCSDEAQFTHKHCGNTGEINDIGGLDKYIPVCRKCFLILNDKTPVDKNNSSGSKSTESQRSLENSP
jgi:thymidine kinase